MKILAYNGQACGIVTLRALLSLFSLSDLESLALRGYLLSIGLFVRVFLGYITDLGFCIFNDSRL